MSVLIFSRARSTSEESLWVNDDGTLAYSHSNDGWAMARQGLLESKRELTAEQAKHEWPELAQKIDEALHAVSNGQR
jgi:hypothetical protein